MRGNPGSNPAIGSAPHEDLKSVLAVLVRPACCDAGRAKAFRA
jgi:hypothetical protein